MKRVLLSKEDFETLVKGGIVKQDGIEIALSDIGHLTMTNIIKSK